MKAAFSLQSRVGIILLLFLVSSTQAGDYGPEYFTPTPLPSLEQRVKEAELIVRVHIESVHHEAVARVREVLKGTYDVKDYPEEPKGCFSLGIPERQLRHDHEEEIWFLRKSQIVYGESIHFHPARAYYDELKLPVRKGIVAFPIVGRRYHSEVIRSQPYTVSDFINRIRFAVQSP